jgi:hypothetical protein
MVHLLFMRAQGRGEGSAIHGALRPLDAGAEKSSRRSARTLRAPSGSHVPKGGCHEPWPWMLTLASVTRAARTLRPERIPQRKRGASPALHARGREARACPHPSSEGFAEPSPSAMIAATMQASSAEHDPPSAQGAPMSSEATVSTRVRVLGLGAVLALSALSAACEQRPSSGGSPASPPSASAAAPLSASGATAAKTPSTEALARAEAAAKKLGGALRTRLADAMNQGGPANAARVCAERRRG